MKADKEILKQSLSSLSKELDRLKIQKESVSVLRRLSERYVDRFNILLLDAQRLYPAERNIRTMPPLIAGLFESDIEPNIRELRMGIGELQEAINVNEKISEKKSERPKNDVETPATPESLFKSLDFHHVIKEASFKLFADGHYAQGIFEAYKALNIYVKNKSGRTDLDGKDLMSKVFSSKRPILQLNPLQNESDEDEQEGFMFLYMGSMVGIRNPKAHEIIQQKDPIKTLEYLALASLLARRVDEATKSDTIKMETEPSKPIQAATKAVIAPKEPSILSKEQLAYRARLKEELIALRILLDNVTNPKEIDFPVWLSNGDFSLRRKLIGNEHDLIQKFYTALQNRYDYQRTMLQPDSKFAELNTNCIQTYDRVVNDVTFVTDINAREQLQAYAQLGEIVSRILGNSPRPGGNLSIPATDFDTIRKIIEEKRSVIADSTAVAWRKAKTATIAHTGESVFDLKLLIEFKTNVQNHLDFLRKQLVL